VMYKNLLATAAVAAITVAGAYAQVPAPGTPPAMQPGTIGTAPAAHWTYWTTEDWTVRRTADIPRLRTDLDGLRHDLDRILETERRAWALGGVVMSAAYNRQSRKLLDQAYSRAAGAVEDLGDPHNVPLGLGHTRAQMAKVAALLHSARVSGDIGRHVAMARRTLDRVHYGVEVYQAGPMRGPTGVMPAPGTLRPVPGTPPGGFRPVPGPGAQ
jgi:hypothetical protein